MKKIFKIFKHLFLLALISVTVIYIWVVNPVMQSTAVQSAPLAHEEKLKQHVKFLVEQEAPRNHLHPKSLNKIADYIFELCHKYQLEPEIQSFKVQEIEYQNVLCHYQKDKSHLIVLGAHYDSAEGTPGADDNASGVAGLLEIARLFSKNKPKLDQAITFAFYTLEEPPYFRTQHIGSYVHAKSLYDAKQSIKMMISIEMIGYFSDKENSQRFPVGTLKYLYPTQGNFIAIIGMTNSNATWSATVTSSIGEMTLNSASISL